MLVTYIKGIHKIIMNNNGVLTPAWPTFDWMYGKYSFTNSVNSRLNEIKDITMKVG